MSKTMRVVVLATSLLSLFAITAASASAATWDVSGTTNLTTTGGAGTLSGNGFSLTCSSSDGTGDAPQGSFAAPGSGLYAAVNGAASFTGCKLGGVTTAVGCTYTFTPQGEVANVVNGFLDVTCSVTQGTTKVCHVTGATPAHYINPVPPNPGRLTLTGSAVLRAHHGTVDCPLVATPATSATASLTHETWTEVSTPSTTIHWTP